MPYARRSNALRGTRARASRSTYRRKGPNIAKVKWQAPTAKAQKSQILANARLLAKHSRLLRRQKIWTDYQYAAALMPTSSGHWAVARLTDFPVNWVSVLRQDANVNESSHTFIQRLQLNLRGYLGDADFAYFNIFIVSKRKNAAEYDPFSTAPTLDTEYVENPHNQGTNIRLNPAIYKVLYSSYRTLTSNTLGNAAIPADTVGNPRTTYFKQQVTLPVRMSVTAPTVASSTTGSSWQEVRFENLPPYHQIFIMIHASWGGTGTISPTFGFDQLATAINVS